MKRFLLWLVGACGLFSTVAAHSSSVPFVLPVRIFEQAALNTLFIAKCAFFLAILLLVVGIVIAYDTFFVVEVQKDIEILNNKDLNFFSKFIQEFSKDMAFFYGLFSILFAVILGIAAAFIRRSISNFREKYFKKAVKQSK